MPHTIQSRLPHLARYLLGTIFFVMGLNGFFHFLKMPPPEGDAGAFMGALAATGYMFPLLKTTETVAGALLLAGRFVPLGLTLLAPVIVNIVMFHLMLSPGLPVVIALLTLELYLAYSYRDAFRGVLDAHARPAAPARGHARRHAHA